MPRGLFLMASIISCVSLPPRRLIGLNRGLRAFGQVGGDEVRFRGVSPGGKGTWRTTITKDGVAHRLGPFDSATAAARAYDDAALRLHGSNAALNFPSEAGMTTPSKQAPQPKTSPPPPPTPTLPPSPPPPTAPTTTVLPTSHSAALAVCLGEAMAARLASLQRPAALALVPQLAPGDPIGNPLCFEVPRPLPVVTCRSFVERRCVAVFRVGWVRLRGRPRRGRCWLSFRQPKLHTVTR